jgi:hypothetical protein
MKKRWYWTKIQAKDDMKNINFMWHPGRNTHFINLLPKKDFDNLIKLKDKKEENKLNKIVKSTRKKN